MYNYTPIKKALNTTLDVVNMNVYLSPVPPNSVYDVGNMSVYLSPVTAVSLEFEISPLKISLSTQFNTVLSTNSMSGSNYSIGAVTWACIGSFEVIYIPLC